MAVKNEHGLTPQQEKFAQEVASGKSLAEAYRIAYPKSLKWADTTLWPHASKMMCNGKVSTRVKALAQKVEQTFVIDTAALLRETSRLAHSNVANILHPDGRVKLPHELDPDTAAAVSSFEMNEKGEIKYKFWDKNSAQERLFKHKGLFEQDNKQQAAGAAEFLKALKTSILGVVQGNEAAQDDED